MELSGKTKRRLKYALPLLLALLVAAWLLSRLLIDVRIGGEDRKEVPPPAHTGGTLREAFESFPLKGDPDSRVELLEGNSEAWAARWRLLGKARESLDVSYFILHQDIFGLSFLGHILEKAREGVRIRILLDALGTRLSLDISGNDYLDTLVAHKNVEVRIYRPWTFRLGDAFLSLKPVALAASDHTKILIANRRLSMTGGRNIGWEYFAEPADDAQAFRDTDARIRGGEAGRSFTAVFEESFEGAEARSVTPDEIDIVDWGDDLLLAYRAMDAWLHGRDVPEGIGAAIRKKGFSWLDDLAKLPRLKGILNARDTTEPVTAEVRLLDSSPRLLKSGDPISVRLLRLAESAQREIVLQTPYLVLPREVLPVLEKAAARGVRITVLTNSPLSSDNAPSQAFFQEQWPELLARVPTLRLFVFGDRHNLHGKVGEIDGQLALVGTYNIDPLSMAVNGEVIAGVWSERMARQVRENTLRFVEGKLPPVYEYRIRRDAQGRPVRDRKGKAIVAFGPRDHSNPDQWKAVNRYWTLLRIAKRLPGSSRLLWTR